jgi:phage-related protein
VRSIQFGDGYQLDQGQGINTVVHGADMVWEDVTQAERDVLVSALEGYKGYGRFTYTIPGYSTAMIWVSQKWSVQKNGPNQYTVNARFDRRFDFG